MTDASVRAERAQQLLDDELLTEALDTLERDAVGTALQAEFKGEDCIAVVAYLQAAYSVRQQLKSVLTTGKAQEQKRPAVA
jgi:hypothetical protein